MHLYLHWHSLTFAPCSTLQGTATQCKVQKYTHMYEYIQRDRKRDKERQRGIEKEHDYDCLFFGSAGDTASSACGRLMRNTMKSPREMHSETGQLHMILYHMRSAASTKHNYIQRYLATCISKRTWRQMQTRQRTLHGKVP